eukprot:TRINITY_DN3625_c0_g2_i1.p1 TRINITY_DN3625_c0_g2~~TRINITY_DN3625_c0_g2_i1.p1  ORF type:complete len:114 (-),score=0.62 TRINITY_DN3625_c0_g2_i1:356-670(-)
MCVQSVTASQQPVDAASCMCINKCNFLADIENGALNVRNDVEVSQSVLRFTLMTQPLERVYLQMQLAHRSCKWCAQLNVRHDVASQSVLSLMLLTCTELPYMRF